jgi:hypothetical protein
MSLKKENLNNFVTREFQKSITIFDYLINNSHKPLSQPVFFPNSDGYAERY